MRHRTARGRIVYREKSGEIGGEHFVITGHSDGARTHRALCAFNDIELLRDVTYSVDAAWRPTDSFVRLTLKDQFLGSAWFRFAEGYAECEAFTAHEGRVSQRMVTAGRANVFVPHSVVGDIWQVGALDKQAGDRPHVIHGRMTSSPRTLGDSGPMLAFTGWGAGVPGTLHLQYRGETEVRVAAGTFPCMRVDIVRKDTPSLELYATGPDLIPVLLKAEFLGQSYELVELRTD
ncbi:MAG: hypothetical protein FJX65_11825 [Alphaproteobacteria bacterium]|nr:hypothetical protein [Alphaproteobacteria bacterium]